MPGGGPGAARCWEATGQRPQGRSPAGQSGGPSTGHPTQQPDGETPREGSGPPSRAGSGAWAQGSLSRPHIQAAATRTRWDTSRLRTCLTGTSVCEHQAPGTLALNAAHGKNKHTLKKLFTNNYHVASFLAVAGAPGKIQRGGPRLPPSGTAASGSEVTDGLAVTAAAGSALLAVLETSDSPANV